jgi:hypothetical protein
MFALTGAPLTVRIPGTRIDLEDKGQGPDEKVSPKLSTEKVIAILANLSDEDFRGFVDTIIADRNVMDELTGSKTIPTVVWAVEVFLEGYLRDIPFPEVNRVRVRRVKFPLFNMNSNPVIPLTQINSRRFDLMERTLGLANHSLDQAKEKDILDVLEQNQDALTNGNPISGLDLLPNRVKTAMKNVF